jgi:hypothetical protein
MLKMAVQQGRSERRGESYFVPHVELLSDARTPLADFFSILLGFRRKLFEYSIESLLLGRRYGKKLETDAVQASPSDCRVADHDWLGISGWLKMQLKLHAAKWADDTLNPAALPRQILDRSRVP